jgi:hypothetical protein
MSSVTGQDVASGFAPPSSFGVWGDSTGVGVVGSSSTIAGQFNGPTAGEFNGDVVINGGATVNGAVNMPGVVDMPGVLQAGTIIATSITKASGTFQIDHPLEPATKYLSHSFVESPDMKNIYDGVVVLDANGEAEIELPNWFEALNTDFRYQLTCIGGYAPVYIAEKVHGNRFQIAGGKPGLEVSWLVTGIRQDVWAKAHPILVEEKKPAEERGYYLNPELYGESNEKHILRVR